MSDPCEEFADGIVDYVDGELPDAEAQAMAHHLAACEPCRRTAEALDRSLRLAKVLWTDNLDGARQSVPVVRSRRIRVYAVAASVFVAVSVILFTVADRRPRPSAIRIEDVERQVAKAGAAAKLLAATQILAQCEGTESIVQEQYRYIVAEYAGTPAAESIRTKHNL